MNGAFNLRVTLVMELVKYYLPLHYYLTWVLPEQASTGNGEQVSKSYCWNESNSTFVGMGLWLIQPKSYSPTAVDIFSGVAFWGKVFVLEIYERYQSPRLKIPIRKSRQWILSHSWRRNILGRSSLHKLAFVIMHHGPEEILSYEHVRESLI